MTACAKCGHDPSALVDHRWTFFVARRVPSLNDRVFNAGVTRFAYAKERNAWSWEFRAARLGNLIPKATKRRRATIVRIFAGRERERDRDNLAGGMKACVDAMVREGLLVDDTTNAAEIHYQQRRGEVSGVLFTLEELA